MWQARSIVLRWHHEINGYDCMIVRRMPESIDVEPDLRSWSGLTIKALLIRRYDFS